MRNSGDDGWTAFRLGTFEFGRRLDNRRRRAAPLIK